MKFSEFVGHEKTKKIIQTKIISTEEDFLKKVVRENHDVSKIDNTKFYFGFYISKQPLKRVYDYIKSWFLRYHIPFKSINPYLTLYLLKNIPLNKKELVDEINDKKEDIAFSTIEDGNILIVEGDNIEIRLEYTPNYEFLNNIEEVFNINNIEIVKKYCYVRLFEIETIPDENFLEDMMFSCPSFPTLNLNNVGIRRR